MNPPSDTLQPLNEPSAILSAKPRSVSGRWLLLVKAAVTVALTGWLIRWANWTIMVERLADAPVLPLALGLAVSFVGIVFAGERWHAACHSIGVLLSHAKALLLMIASLFFGQVLPGATGGDMVRGWLTWRDGQSPGAVILAVLLDRLIALFGVIVLLFVGLPRLIEVIPNQMAWALPLIALAGIGVLVGSLQIDRLPLPARLRNRRSVAVVLSSISRLRAALRSGTAGVALIHSVLVHLCTVATAAFYSSALHLPIGPIDLLAVMPAAIIATALPISLNGWGVREGTMVAGLALFKVPLDDALLLSLMIGLSGTLTAMPGGVAWLVLSRANRRNPLQL